MIDSNFRYHSPLLFHTPGSGQQEYQGPLFQTTVPSAQHVFLHALWNSQVLEPSSRQVMERSGLQSIVHVQYQV